MRGLPPLLEENVWRGIGGDEAVVIQLLDDVGGPSGDATDGKDGGVEVDVDAQSSVGGGGVEIDVGVELLVGVDVELYGAGHLKPLGYTGVLAELFAHLAQVGGAGVLGLVDAVAEAGDLLLGGEHVLDVFHRIGAGFINGRSEEHTSELQS